MSDIGFARTGRSKKSDERGMRPMQAEVYKERGAQYLLLKAPPAAGKSRALMFVALDKLRRQKLRKVIVAVPEKSIGGSFKDTDLKSFGYDFDWHVDEKYDLCKASSETSAGTVATFLEFLDDDQAEVLLCTHATLRFAFEKTSVEKFDDCLLAVDEFHHASASDGNKLGNVVRLLMQRDRAHIMAMTGSYFRGDRNSVMRPEDEERFTPVTFSYFHQLDGYEHLKNLNISYHFYKGSYLDRIAEVLDPDKRTILHIPNVNSGESSGDKRDEVGRIIDLIGKFTGTDPETGFLLVERPDGTTFRIAELVDDEPLRRSKVVSALRNIESREELDMVIALGMAKEGFDWVWCERALTVGYRKSMTEVIQIIGRTTRDAPGKETAEYINMIAEPNVEDELVISNVNNLLKVISASLLMHQVMIPKIRFHEPDKDKEDGEITVDAETGDMDVIIKGIRKPTSEKGLHILENQLDDARVAITTDPVLMRKSMAGVPASALIETDMAGVLIEKFPGLIQEDAEAIAEHLVAEKFVSRMADEMPGQGSNKFRNIGLDADLTRLNIDLIRDINYFEEAHEIMSKNMDSGLLSQVDSLLSDRRGDPALSPEEARALYDKIKAFIAKNGREPSVGCDDPIERRLGQALRELRRLVAEHKGGA
ncbi:DEAD/DEAH box helicase family protein [Sulfitobacter sp. R18_1]|uniref:DEAD/DEAH box helicase n=1 Tax=Sulfitobacter sp. R18_1 TaxID=2821104 RepID=UPI001ADC0974|nr:DEAD/DEAH box helicase family protein [Sulfitobacter sp. R18_1]MBO9428753.1 DEAD/DEAH box helicase [Sulfitobacter sp. R18_1]